MLPVAAMVRAMDTAVIPCGTAAREATVPVCCNARPSINMGYFIYLVGFFFLVCVCVRVLYFLLLLFFFFVLDIPTTSQTLSLIDNYTLQTSFSN